MRAKGQLEGIDAGPVAAGSGRVRILAWFDRSAAPEHSGGLLPQYVANVKSFGYMEFPLNTYDSGLDLRGTGVFQCLVAGDIWSNVSMEFDEFTLQ